MFCRELIGELGQLGANVLCFGVRDDLCRSVLYANAATLPAAKTSSRVDFHNDLLQAAPACQS